MVVALGFGFVHSGNRDVEREGEEERQKLKKGEMILVNIFYCIDTLF